MDKKSLLIIGVVILVAIGIYNQVSLGPFVECGFERDGSLDCGDELDCPMGQKKCQSADRTASICCGAKDICGTAPDSGSGGRDKVWCVPINPKCPKGTTICKASNEPGASTACCPTGYSCKTSSHSGTAWCSPNTAKQCPTGWSFVNCQESNICCPANAVAKCTTGLFTGGWATCDYSVNSCAQGQTVCGRNCCNAGDSCVDFGYGFTTCSLSSCPEGQEICTGAPAGFMVNICCDSETCVPSSGGSARCTTEWPYTNLPLTPTADPATDEPLP